MTTVTIVWIALPFFLGLSGYLVPVLARYVALVLSLGSIAYAMQRLIDTTPLTLDLLDSFGVTLLADQTSGFFILTNALVTLAVVFYCWNTGKSAFFYAQVAILHGSVNAIFICSDFMSLYVALEVISITAFLLITYPRSDRSIWVALRYLFVSNTAMLFYLVGAVMVYKANHSFAFDGLVNAPLEAIALVGVGLLTKSGVFISGLWLPMTHSEADTPVSALLSGAVIKSGTFPLVRCALILDDLQPVIQIFAVATAILGVTYAICEKDTKRMLAFSTISQVGFVLAQPVFAGFYALSHGLAKSTLFLIAGNLPSRNFNELKDRPIKTPIWVAMVVASLSISGFPLLAGFGAKILSTKELPPVMAIALSIAAVGTVITFAKLIFLPHATTTASAPKLNLWMAIIPLLIALVAASGFHLEVYTLGNFTKPLLTIALGWFAYFLLFRRIAFRLPRLLEQLDHLIGMMSVILVLLFWMVLA